MLIVKKLFKWQKIDEFLCNLTIGKDFLLMTQNPCAIKEKTDTFNYINIKSVHRPKTR